MIESSRPRLSVGFVAFLTVLVSLFVFLPLPILAASVCYDDRYYPAVYKLEETGTGFTARLGGNFVTPTPEKRTGNPVIESPVLIFKKDRWNLGKVHTCTGFYCNEKSDLERTPLVPAIVFSRDEAISLDPSLRGAVAIDQDISSWISYGGFIWFGLGFYSGEGSSGIGGIGRYNPKTRELQVRHPQLIRDSSTFPIFHDEEYIWLGTRGNYECMGSPPTHGLIRYDWQTDRIESFEKKKDGPCGLLIHDFLKEGKNLWVATDFGLSRWDTKNKKWDNYLPDPTAPPFMKPITCNVLYTVVLDTIPKDSSLEGADYSFDEDTIGLLRHYRPEIIEQYLAQRKKQKRK